MKKVLLFVFLVLMSLSAFALTPIKGTILDAGNQAPLEFVNIALLKQDTNSMVSGVTSDKDGVFFLPAVENGKYTLRISYIGYNTINQKLDVTGKSMNVGILKLVQNSKSLNEVEVVGQGSQMHFDIDKKVFSVDQNIAAAGGSASDVLKNIPSVTVDIQGNVSLRKDGNVEVWINGKASGLTADNRAQVLQQMPAENIESIEIMTNPSAKYSPEGSAGIINIVMKKQHKAGYYGSVSAGLTYPDGGKIGKNVGANINYSSSKIDSYINLGYRAMSFNGGAQTDRKNWINGNDTTLLSQKSSSLMAFSGLFMRAGIDYHIDQRNTIGLSGFGMAGSGIQNNSSNNVFTNIMTTPATYLKAYTRDNNATGTRPSLNLNMDYKHEFDKKGSNLMASISYSNHYRSSNTDYIQNDSLPTIAHSDINQNTGSLNTEWDLKVDYTNKLTEHSKLEAGWESTIGDRLSTSIGIDNIIALSTNMIPEIASYFDSFKYDEQIHAGYVTYGNRIDKFTYQLGLRAEIMTKHSSDTTRVTYTLPVNVQNINSTPIFHVFPSFYLSYTLPKDAEIQFNYTNRVNRPRGQQINPYKNYSDPTNISYGNPDLLPQYSSSLELNYIKTWGAQTLSSSLYYHYTDDVIENVRFLNSSGIMESTYMNIAKSQNTGLELISKNRLFKILSLTTTLNFYYNKLDSSVYVNPYIPTIRTAIPGQNSFSWTANVMANFILSKTFSGQITAEYESPQLIAQGTENAKYSIDMGFRQTFLDRKISVSLNVRDLLNSDRDRQTTSGVGFYQNTNSYFHGRMLMLTASYNFGNMKPKPADMKKQAAGAADMNMDGGL